MKIVIFLMVCVSAAISAKLNCVFPCVAMFAPVCGHDGETYSNECMMRGAACKQQRAITAVYKGKCKAQDGKRCLFPCNKMLAPVCGHDGKSYSNECVMRAAACAKKTPIVQVSRGSIFSDNKCSDCAIPCTREYKPVCGSDGKTYATECVMRAQACKQRKAIVKVYNGKCRYEKLNCLFPCNRMYAPVCGHDGKTYSNECMMRAQACQQGKAITVVHKGECSKDNAKLNCVFPCVAMFAPVCGHDGRTYSNECMMRGAACKQQKAITAVYKGNCKAQDGKRCLFPCNKMFAPVCGHDGKSYSNECVMRAAACAKKTPIVQVSRGSIFSDNKCSDCAIPCTREYKPVCGSDGKTYATECVMRAQACKQRKAIVKVYNGKCRYEKLNCLFPCNRMYAPVCGHDGKTYSNECMMRAQACQQGKAITVVHKGECSKDNGKRCLISCNRMRAPVCGSDGKMYSNECTMRVAACEKQMPIVQVSRSYVRPDTKCSDCRIACTREYRPVCGSDGKTYPTACVMKSFACTQRKAITVVYQEECKYQQ